MPKERTNTNHGDHIEVQWAKGGELVCIVSVEQRAPETRIDTMVQFTDAESMDRVIANLRRARRAAFPH